ILEHILPWIDDDIDDNLLAFDVLDQFLTTEGHQAENQGYTLSLKPFVVNVEAVAELRQRVIDAAFSALLSNEPKTPFRALKTIEHALERPHGLGGATITTEAAAAWEPGIIKTLERLAMVVG